MSIFSIMYNILQVVMMLKDTVAVKNLWHSLDELLITASVVLTTVTRQRGWRPCQH